MSKQPAKFLEEEMNIYGQMPVPKPGLWQSLRNFRYLLKLRFYAYSGMLDREATTLGKSIDWSTFLPGRPTVLCLRRATFIKDIDEMRRLTDVNYVTISAARIKTSQQKWVPVEWQMQTYFTRFLANQLVAFRPWLLRFGRVFIETAMAEHRVDAILAANTDYWQDEALRVACRELGVPFLVLCRENYSIKQDEINVLRHFGRAAFKYTGTAVAVYSRSTRDVMERIGGYPKDGVWVTGAPRFDRWHEVSQITPDKRDHMTLISYAYPIYGAMKNFGDVGKIFATLADRNPSLRFVVKLKKENEYKEATEECPALAAARVEFVADAPLFELLPHSRVVIGCNSLAVAEGLLAGVPIIIPAWADALSNQETCLFHYANPRHAECFYFPRSAEEFEVLISQAVAGTLPVLGTPAQRLACFNEHLEYQPGVTSSQLVKEFILRFVGSQS